MSLSHDKVTDVAGIVVSLSTDVNKLWAKVHAVLEYNADMGIEWNADTTPDYINEDEDGNLQGMNVSRQEVYDAGVALSQIRKLLTNQVPTQGDHLSTLHQIGRPITIR